MIKRRIQIEDSHLFFEYEVSPHRLILARRSNLEASDVCSEMLCQTSNESPSQNFDDETRFNQTNRATGFHIPFKQVRLKGQINPLKPPLHVETVLIGRALGQQTGYVAGVGFRIRDDGYVEGEFECGTEKFLSFGDFEKAVMTSLKQIPDDNS
jgi:hypothetical protein